MARKLAAAIRAAGSLQGYMGHYSRQIRLRFAAALAQPETDKCSLADGAAQLISSCSLMWAPISFRILVKVDRATMAASLETRAPFLDHRGLAAWRLPLGLKIRGGCGKWAAPAPGQYVPLDVGRPKASAMPIGV